MGSEKFKQNVENLHKLIFEECRLETFKSNWKELKGFKYCTPKNFAAAGFYNYSTTTFCDTVKCFACEKELSDWEKNDDPWVEHSKRGAKCPYVIFKTKSNTTLEDFLKLYYATARNILNGYFEEQKEVLKEKGKVLSKALTTLQKSKK